MIKKKYVYVLLWAGINILPVMAKAQPQVRSKWLKPILASDSVVTPISKKNLQQLGAVEGARPGLRLFIQGPSNTTEQASVLWLAKKWNKEVYRIDLSQVISKYIGETEKNLNNVFADTRANTAILYFDEADALFGKRTPVKDSHDRYANQETSYLLSRLENFTGIAVLASNYRGKVDSNFLRYFKYIINTD